MHPQLPPRAYFSEALLNFEMDRIFASRPQYAGHELLVPNLYDYCSLPHHNHGLMMVRNESGVAVLSNVCRHRQATIMKGRGNARRLSCPMHRWTYDTNGGLSHAPNFSADQCAHIKLQRFQTESWNGLRFIGHPEKLSELKEIPQEIQGLVNFDDYYFGHVEEHDCAYNWKTFVEFYLEDYHVAPFHPGLGRFVSCNDLKWHFGKNWSAQTVGFHRNLQNPGESEVYRAWHDAVLNFYAGSLPSVAAIWLMIYPNVMIEWYPMVLVISTIYPSGADSSKNIVEYYHPKVLLERANGQAMAELAAQAYLETALEDNEIGVRMQEGRYALFKRGATETGPYQLPLESGMEHFHRYLRHELGFAALLNSIESV
ncbi:hypothetical protein WS51_02055 [Burkholderia territorii]|uniref:aromatic ring-hydroxylating oxygenase subunit alpha n=1 Tax=Burkholderia territorii TaxID=1503055 RepID=UPI000842150B|nr:aromatic ring-hydroxylating dioxygenase subunit alpha [Burkholderia territorii]AOI62457.1 hypothetical protein WS51_02055 [Burkholderia territorii]